jgi:hypothetical protein
MSRELPSRPNLEHLKKQARRRLSELQRENPAAKLADALHETARGYGFATWPQLKAHVASLEPAVNPFTGRWTANVAKSKRHPLNTFQQATLEFDVAGDVVTIRHIAVEASGREERDTNTMLVDGKEHLVDRHGNGYVARWLAPSTLDVEARQHERTVARGTYEISADGQTMIVSTAEQRIVLDRVRPDVPLTAGTPERT